MFFLMKYIGKKVNTKSVVIINYRKINHQQKNPLIICKQLKGPVLKSLKSKRSGPKSKNKNLKKKFTPGRNLKFSFGPSRT